jgi:polysaccharide deacetylase 2 family uncharacterized protein YibQ
VRDGRAIGIGHPRPATLEALREAIPEIERRGVTFVPITALREEG